MTNKKQDSSAKKPIPPDVQQFIDDKLKLDDKDKQDPTKVNAAFQKAITDKQNELKSAPQASQKGLQDELTQLQDIHNKYKKATEPDVKSAQQKEPEKKKSKVEAMVDKLADGFDGKDSMSQVFKSGMGVGRSLKKMFESKPDDNKKPDEDSTVVLGKSSDTKVGRTPTEEELPDMAERRAREHDEPVEHNEQIDEEPRNNYD